MTLMKVYLRLLLFVLYVTDEGVLKIITVRVYVTDEDLLKMITVRVV
jgi:hypothetical protein